MNLGDRIKEYRSIKGYTQEQLADKANISKNGLWNYENNKRSPSLEIIDKIADALGITRNALLTVKKSYRPNKSLKMVYDLFEEIYNHSRVKDEMGLSAEEFMEKDKYFIFQLREEMIQLILLNSKFLKRKILNNDNVPMENLAEFFNSIKEKDSQKSEGKYDDPIDDSTRLAVQEDIDQLMGM